MKNFKMTTHERIKRMYEHKEADRVPIVDVLWNSTRERWEEQGMPPGVDMSDYFDIDHIPKIDVDNSFRFEEKVIEETEDYIIKTTEWGATFRNWKHQGSTPECIDYKIINPEKWYEAKKRMVPSPNRIPWDYLKAKGILLRGGNNAMLWDDFEEAEAGMRKIIPAMKESGGYIFASDHSIPDSVKFDTYKKIVILVKEIGKY